MSQSGKNKGSNNKVANSLVAVSCGAVLAVYAAGYARTRSAASFLDAQAVERRVASPEPQAAEPIDAPVPDEPLNQPRAEVTPRTNPKAFAAVQASPEVTAAPVTLLPDAPAPVVVETTVPPPVHVAEVVVPPPPAPKWKDGTYTGWGYSRHGNIEATVVIAAGRIAEATISQCHTRYSCSVIEQLPPQVAQRQSPDVDYVSRATQSADAFYGAVVEALAKAK